MDDMSTSDFNAQGFSPNTMESLDKSKKATSKNPLWKIQYAIELPKINKACSGLVLNLNYETGMLPVKYKATSTFHKIKNGLINLVGKIKHMGTPTSREIRRLRSANNHFSILMDPINNNKSSYSSRVAHDTIQEAIERRLNTLDPHSINRANKDSNFSKLSRLLTHITRNTAELNSVLNDGYKQYVSHKNHMSRDARAIYKKQLYDLEKKNIQTYKDIGKACYALSHNPTVPTEKLVQGVISLLTNNHKTFNDTLIDATNAKAQVTHDKAATTLDKLNKLRPIIVSLQRNDVHDNKPINLTEHMSDKLALLKSIYDSTSKTIADIITLEDDPDLLQKHQMLFDALHLMKHIEVETAATFQTTLNPRNNSDLKKTIFKSLHKLFADTYRGFEQIQTTFASFQKAPNLQDEEALSALSMSNSDNPVNPAVVNQDPPVDNQAIMYVPSNDEPQAKLPHDYHQVSNSTYLAPIQTRQDTQGSNQTLDINTQSDPKHRYSMLADNTESQASSSNLQVKQQQNHHNVKDTNQQDDPPPPLPPRPQPPQTSVDDFGYSLVNKRDTPGRRSRSQRQPAHSSWDSNPTDTRWNNGLAPTDDRSSGIVSWGDFSIYDPDSYGSAQSEQLHNNLVGEEIPQINTQSLESLPQDTSHKVENWQMSNPHPLSTDDTLPISSIISQQPKPLQKQDATPPPPLPPRSQ